jgi:hypothetical protein
VPAALLNACPLPPSLHLLLLASPQDRPACLLKFFDSMRGSSSPPPVLVAMGALPGYTPVLQAGLTIHVPVSTGKLYVIAGRDSDLYGSHNHVPPSLRWCVKLAPMCAAGCFKYLPLAPRQHAAIMEVYMFE